ncbi:MAG: bifunctional heptose 7-phosphate kinase/heptose 1-phosphate adenyltransferase [Planctomycetota bacterium]
MPDPMQELILGLGRPRVGVIGDLMLDEYVWGDVERISPEAPIPVLRVSRREHRAGGAGSVVVNLARLGVDVFVFGALGRDESGDEVAGIFRSEGADLTGLHFEPGRPTTRKCRHIGFVQQAHRAVQQILRVDEEDTRPISDDVRDRILSSIEKRASELDAILISDYGKGLIDETLVQGVLQIAGDKPVLVDPARIEDYSLYQGVTLICPNRFETELASGVGCRDLEGSREAGEKLVKQHGIQVVAVTLDRDGILLCQEGKPAEHLATRVRAVADVTGAGDMVLSVLGLVVASGKSFADAARLANVGGGIEVRRVGVSPVSREELLQELRYSGHPAASKIKSLPELRELVQRDQRAGLSVVFTNGCFDLLHRGHHELLHGARQEGDRMVVAVNADDSIRRLKGPTRPSIPEDGRVRMLAALEVVDYVIVFSEDTPNHLLEALRPDVLVKGGEYRDGVVVGHEIVEGYGGRIAYVDQIPGYSTTSLLGEDKKD